MAIFLKIFVLATLGLMAVGVGVRPAKGATPGTNPIITDAFTADPAPLVLSNTVYLYTGHDQAQPGDSYTMTNWRCYSSPNLTNWTSYGSILSFTNFSWASGSAWAGQCVQNNGKYYWYVPMMGNGNYGGFNIGVAVSASPTGPFQDAIGVPLITDGMTTGGDAWDDIDPTVFTDTNGVSWLGWGHGTFYLVQLGTNMISLAGPIQVNRHGPNLPYYTEGPFLHRHGNLYYLSYASIDNGSEKIRYATAPAINGPWTPRGLITGYAANSYTIQDGIFDFNGQSYMVYHNGALSGGGSFNRSVCLDYLYYNPDGSIQPIVQTAAGVSVPPRNDNLLAGVVTAPWPAMGVTNVPWSPTLRWLPGNNAVAHAVYVGTSSNSVAQAGFAAPEFQGIVATTNFTPAALAPLTVCYWRVDEIRGTNQNPGPVWSFTTGPFLAHRYSFTGSGGTTVMDSADGPAWAGTLHNGATLGGGMLSFTSAAQQYVSLPAGLASSLSGITLMAWVNLNTNSNWSRIFDLGNNTTSYLYLTAQNANSSAPQFGITASGSGGEVQMTATTNLSTGVWHQVAITLSGNTGIPGLTASGGTGVLYVDGAKASFTESLTLNPSILGGMANNYLGKSQYGGDPYFNGAMEEFRIYNGAMTADGVAQAWELGPTQVAPNLPYPWTTVDIGTVGVQGSANYSNGVFTVAGAGADVQNTADAFRWVYVTARGNCSITARLTTEQNINAWTKAGVMIRESSATNAANVFAAVTPGNGVTWQNRASTGGTTAFNNTSGKTAPYWVRLVRNGNTFTGYVSPDGVNWTQQGTTNFILTTAVEIGLALTSHSSGTLATATFDNVTVISAPPAAPAGLTATAGNGQAVLTWPASSTATSYNVKRALINGWQYTVTNNVTSTNFTATGLVNGTNYYYVVSALNLAGESANSFQAMVMPMPPPSPRIVGAAMVGGNLVFSGSNGLAGGAFTIWSATNLTTPLSGWLPAGGGTFDAQGIFGVTNALNANAPVQFFLLRQP